MTTATKKKIAWFLFATSLGSLLLYVLVEWGDFRWEFQILLWPIGSLLLLALSILRLRAHYRAEPFRREGNWHLSLSDLLIATCFAGGWMAFWKLNWPDSFLFWGAAVSLIAGIWLLAGMLAAELRGFKAVKTKLTLAIGLALKSYGYFSWAFLAALLSLDLLYDGYSEFLRTLNELISQPDTPYSPSERQVVAIVRVSLSILPLGWLICKLVEHFAPKQK